LTVNCPTCHAEVQWSEVSQFRPFCSARCKGIDLGDWASNRFVVAGRDPTDFAGDSSLSAIEANQ